MTKEVSAVCSSCPGGGTTADLFSYHRNPHYPGNGYNTWKTRTTQSLPDGSKVVFYGNYSALPMLIVNIDPTGLNMWGTFYRYANDGQVMWEAHPSAVALPASLSTLEAYNDLLNFNPGTGLYQYLNNSSGLIDVTTYDGRGNVLSESVQQGQTGTPVLVKSLTYTSNTDSAGNTITPIASQSEYPIAGDTTTAFTTSFAYTFYAGTNQISQKTTTLPIVSAAQNGSGVADTTIDQFDAYGNNVESTDERGIVNQFAFDPVTSLRISQVLNYQSGITAPGVNATTNFSSDDLGRPLLTLGEAHTVVIGGAAVSVQPVTSYAYNESAQPGSAPWGTDQNTVAKGYFDGTSYTIIDPVTVTNADKDGRNIDSITSHRTTGSGLLSPTDTYAQTDWQTWSSMQFNPQHQTISSRTYFLIPASGTGTVGTNFAQTDNGYDALERKNRIQSPGGTITRTVWTTPQWVASIWVGTNDNGATDSDPTGGGASGNNMVMVTSNQYDFGNPGGDGNLTDVTDFVSATSGDTRDTTFGYDFRDRRTSSIDPLGVYTLWGLDNLGHQTLTQQYASFTSNLISQSAAAFDARGKQYQTLVYAVNATTGAVGNVLTGNTWFDPSGNSVQTIAPGGGQVFTKTSINGVGWVTGTYTGYNTSGTSYAQAQTVAGDIIVEQSQRAYDEVGNTISSASFQRLNDASTTTTGALTSANARIMYRALWLDGIDRGIAAANYGAASSFTRPSTPPVSSSTVLVNQTAYDTAGRAFQATNPKGVINQTGYDNASRSVQTIEDVGGLARTTNYAYTLDSAIRTMTAVNPVTGDQTTTWNFGTTLAESGVARNDLVRYVQYPDSTGGSDLVKYAYNRLSEKRTILDQRGNVHTLYRDKLGRQTNDCITTLGSATDGTVLQIAWAYEIRGMVSTITSYDSATQNSGTVLNQVQLNYNDFRQLVSEPQSHSGAVTGSTPSVGYAYDPGSGTSNEIRLNALNYPNGRVISYNSAAGIDAALNRVTSISDPSATLASYTYLGLGSVVRITYPQPGVRLDLWGGTSGTFAGRDLFNRVIDQRWQTNIGSTPTDIDRYQYGYDFNSNRLYKANVVGTLVVTAGLDEYYTMDNLNRLTDMQRGVLNSTNTGITGTPTVEQNWALDPTGNWGTFTTSASGSVTVTQPRTSNTVNEITVIGSVTPPATPPTAWVTPAYDAAGNMTTMPQVTTPTDWYAGLFDAWNRMTTISDVTGTIAQYQYDGRNFRIVAVTALETRHFYFTDSWHDVEQRVGTTTTGQQQNVWGVRYSDELVCRDDVTHGRLYACQDANFNVTCITDDTGTVVQRLVYEPYGISKIYRANWHASGDLFAWTTRFTGQQFSLNTGIHLYRNRYYLPGLGQFASRDPAGYVDGANEYSFVGDNPCVRVDQTGEDFIALADRRVGDIGDLSMFFYHYSLEYWSTTDCKGGDNTYPGGEEEISLWAGFEPGAKKVASVELLSEKWHQNPVGGFETDVSTIHYSDAATKFAAIDYGEPHPVRVRWQNIIDAAKSYAYAEQSGAGRAMNWPNSHYETDLSGNNSNTFVRSIVLSAGLEMSKLSGWHPGADTPHAIAGWPDGVNTPPYP